MNNGFFGFPGSPGVKFIETVTFDTSGIYIIPRAARTLIIYAIGAGAGGTSGARGAALANASGGGGGGGGGEAFHILHVDSYKNYQDDLTSVQTSTAYAESYLMITIGAGGNGGTAGGTNGSTNVAGASGGRTIIGFGSGLSTSRLLMVRGGNAGSTTNGGVASTPLLFGFRPAADSGGRGGAGATSKPSAISVATPTTSAVSIWSGAAGGGGFTNASNTAAAGGDNGYLSAASNTYSSLANPFIPRGTTLLAGGTINGGSTGTDAPPYNICGKLTPGFGGAGGGGALLTGATRGGHGYRGGGGGGGGGSKAGIPAGNGGNGGNGYVCIVALE